MTYTPPNRVENANHRVEDVYPHRVEDATTEWKTLLTTEWKDAHHRVEDVATIEWKTYTHIEWKTYTHHEWKDAHAPSGRRIPHRVGERPTRVEDVYPPTEWRRTPSEWKDVRPAIRVEDLSLKIGREVEVGRIKGNLASSPNQEGKPKPEGCAPRQTPETEHQDPHLNERSTEGMRGRAPPGEANQSLPIQGKVHQGPTNGRQGSWRNVSDFYNPETGRKKEDLSQRDRALLGTPPDSPPKLRLVTGESQGLRQQTRWLLQQAPPWPCSVGLQNRPVGPEKGLHPTGFLCPYRQDPQVDGGGGGHRNGNNCESRENGETAPPGLYVEQHQRGERTFNQRTTPQRSKRKGTDQHSAAPVGNQQHSSKLPVRYGRSPAPNRGRGKLILAGLNTRFSIPHNANLLTRSDLDDPGERDPTAEIKKLREKRKGRRNAQKSHNERKVRQQKPKRIREITEGTRFINILQTSLNKGCGGHLKNPYLTPKGDNATITYPKGPGQKGERRRRVPTRGGRKTRRNAYEGSANQLINKTPEKRVAWLTAHAKFRHHPGLTARVRQGSRCLAVSSQAWLNCLTRPVSAGCGLAAAYGRQ
nr:hypothetical protein Iba_chr13fCG9670 [Ipomoea batatas]GMD82603.1 hypothetical protein Iba_chr13fCG9680 [Ipomoea batatas]